MGSFPQCFSVCYFYPLPRASSVCVSEDAEWVTSKTFKEVGELLYFYNLEAAVYSKNKYFKYDLCRHYEHVYVTYSLLSSVV